MDKRRWGTTEIEVSPIGLGCMQFSGGRLGERVFPGVNQEIVRDVVRTALDNGISWFDTAEMYGQGRSERALTTALRALDVEPGTVAIATKWMPILRTASSIGRTVDSRLAALQGYPIDLHQIHVPYGSLSTLDSQIRAMAKLADTGKISSIGVSNFSARQMEKASRLLRSYGLSLTSNQVQISLLHRNIERNGVLKAARRLGVTLIAHTPLKSGILTGKFHDDPSQIRSVNAMRRRLNGLSDKTLTRSRPLIDELRAIAHAYDVTPGQVALSWLVRFYGDTVVAIPGASRPRQAQESAGAIELRLTEKELDRLDEVSRRCGDDGAVAA
jgi:aryl-alcohol dehydrogenase-like predicted oxidoreductase